MGLIKKPPFFERWVENGRLSNLWRKWFSEQYETTLDHDTTHVYQWNNNPSPPPVDLTQPEAYLMPETWKDEGEDFREYLDPEPSYPTEDHREYYQPERPMASEEPLRRIETDVSKTPDMDDVMLAQMAVSTMENSSGQVPAGLIAMFSGATVPSGWALCDGNNGTPDLRDKFIVGSGSTYSIGNTGGAATVTLQETNLPAHTHTIADDGTHDGHVIATEGAASGTDFNADTSYATVPDHDHGGATGSVGSGTAVDILPPYYALAFIMKL